MIHRKTFVEPILEEELAFYNLTLGGPVTPPPLISGQIT